MRSPTALSRLIEALFVQRSAALRLGISFVLGAAYTLSMLPLGLLSGSGGFWEFPRGTIHGADSDMANGLVGYLYFVHSPWQWPVLSLPNLGAPTGTNLFWLGDAVPLVSLAGKLIFTATGVEINLLGAYLFASFVLTGMAMVTLLAAARQRNLIAAIVGTIIGVSTPFLLYRWGHMSLAAQFLIVFALAHYVKGSRQPSDWRISTGWMGLVSVALLVDAYIFLMVGACCGAALFQRWLNRNISSIGALAEGTAVGACTLGLMFIMGILTDDLRSAGDDWFGILSMNLASPLIPQLSGLIPPLEEYRVGTSAQYEGFSYLGCGVIVYLLLGLRRGAGWIKRRVRSHIALICVLVCATLLALSNKIYFGHRLLLEIPLPDRVHYMLGAVHSSGRFFWLVGYALEAGGILMVLGGFRRPSALVVLGLACAVQLIDVDPIRGAVAASATHPAVAVIERQRAAAIVAQSGALKIFPSYPCVDTAIKDGTVSASARERVAQANMEFQLLTARADLPINSVYNSRLQTDCRAEDRIMRDPLQDGTTYIYLGSFVPTGSQRGGRAMAEVCNDLDWLRYCILRSSPVFERPQSGSSAQPDR